MTPPALRVEKPKPGDLLNQSGRLVVVKPNASRSPFAPCRHRTVREKCCEATYICALGHGQAGIIEPEACAACPDIQP